MVGMGCAILCGPGNDRCKELTYTYEQPTSILKTNNITLITYIDSDLKNVKFKQYDTAEMWNSTNIVIKKIMGRNFFGIKMDGYDWEFVSNK